MIYIRKNGIFYENDYKPETEKYIMIKIESVIPYLNEVIRIDAGITLEDLFSIIEEDEDIFNVVFGSHLGHFPLRPFIDEINKNCLPESREELEFIELSWVAEQFDYKKFYEKFKDEKRDENNIFTTPSEPDGSEVNEIDINVDVHGWGKYEPQEDEVYEEGEEPPTRTCYGIDFIPLYRLKHLSIKLNKDFILREDKYDGKENIVVQGEKEFTVFEVFGEILSEITFAGLPEDRDEQWRDVLLDVEGYKEKLDNEENDEKETENS